MAKKQILVIEDEEDILALIHYNLVKAGYRVECATSGEEGLEKAALLQPDLLVLDLMLPGINGLEVCRRLRTGNGGDTAIVMLTAKGEEADIVAGLELGADDYVTKPFSPQILLARIKAVLRRREQGTGDSDQAPVLSIHDLVIDAGRNKVIAAGQEVELTLTEFRVLRLLAGRPGWVFTRAQIVDGVRGEGYAVTDRSVDVQIVGLRKKLGECGAFIETVRGVGYRFKE